LKNKNEPDIAGTSERLDGEHHDDRGLGAGTSLQKDTTAKERVPTVIPACGEIMKGKPILEPLGDQGILARCADEDEALRWGNCVRTLGVEWLVDVVQAYTTVAVFHDRDQISLIEVLGLLDSLPVPASEVSGSPGRLHVIPCCYELGADLQRIAQHTGLSGDEVITLHCSTIYTIYAIGFCPGFPYLGYLPDLLCGVPRLDSPRFRVEPGSVGLTGRQTGIYPEPRPGGWNLIGRTPLVLVDVLTGYFPLRTGDRVCFERIDETQYRRLSGQRL
jgi:inhibitor of KinA